jgi:hypothetical protein
MIPLGTGDIPTTATELSSRIESGVRDLLGLEVASPLSIETAVSSPDDIDLISIDATGASLATIPDDAGASRRFVEPATLGPAFVHRMTVVASPMNVLGLPVTLRAEMSNLNGTWSRADRAELWILPAEPARDRPVGGSATLSLAVVDIERFVHDQLADQLRSRGFKLASLDLDISQAGPNGVRVEGLATVKKSILSAKVTVTGTGTLDDQLALHITDVAVSSPNAMVNAMIAPFMGPIEKWNGRVIPLADYAIAGVRVQSARLTVGDAVEIHTTLGSDASV